MLNKHTLTTLDYYYGTLDHIDNNKLTDYITKFGERMSDDETDTRYEDTIIDFNKDIMEVAVGISDEFEKATGCKLSMVEHWSHIHEKNQSTNTHNHGDPDNMSAVYYVKVPDGAGKFVFDYHQNEVKEKRAFIIPHEGHFVLFPSSINHFVTRNTSDDKRISLSFNFEVKNG